MDRMVRGLAEKRNHKEDKTRPKPIRGWPVEPEIFTEILFKRRKSQAKRPYLVRHPKMEQKQKSIDAGYGHGPSMSGGPDARDDNKVSIVVGTHIDTPRPALPHQVYSNQELIDLQCKENDLYNFLYFALGGSSHGISIQV